MTSKTRLTAIEKQLLDAGFRQVYTPAGAEPLPPAQPAKLAGLKKGQRVTPQHVRVRRHPPPPFPAMSEAALIKELRTRGIGRPSTYAPIVATLLEKRYATRVESGLRSTPRGRAVCDFLVKTFPALCAYEFTAHMEAALDALAHGRQSYLETVRGLWEALPKTPVRPSKKKETP